MKPLFHPHLVNEPFGDPALYVEFLFEKRALLFDLGDLHDLPPRKALRISDVFVSHAHMDHFVGFDQLLRLCLGREKRLRLFGPAGFMDHVEGHLNGYTWNLVENYQAEFVLEVTEIHSSHHARRARFPCRRGFRREDETALPLQDGIVVDEPLFQVRTAVLDHKIPCLAFALEESLHVNVWKNRLTDRGLPTGPWLRELKEAVLRGEPDTAIFRIWWRENGQTVEHFAPLGELKRELLRLVPGQKLAYVVDVVYHKENARRIAALAQGADLLFIEAAFMAEDADHAAEKFHLTTLQAGRLARRAQVKRMEPFHFSPKYADQEAELRAEAQAAFLAASPHREDIQ